MDCIERIRIKMEDFYRENPPTTEQIKHTTDVVDYTIRLAKAMGCEAHHVDLLHIAALLHDIGCPKARLLHGKSLPIYQEQYGKEMATEWLKDCDELTAEEKIWLADVVGFHHHPRQATEMNFRPLFEGDTIVNMYEGYYKPGQEQQVFDALMVTEQGRTLFKDMFLK